MSGGRKEGTEGRKEQMDAPRELELELERESRGDDRADVRANTRTKGKGGLVRPGGGRVTAERAGPMQKGSQGCGCPMRCFLPVCLSVVSGGGEAAALSSLASFLCVAMLLLLYSPCFDVAVQLPPAPVVMYYIHHTHACLAIFVVVVAVVLEVLLHASYERPLSSQPMGTATVDATVLDALDTRPSSLSFLYSFSASATDSAVQQQTLNDTYLRPLTLF